jgi:chorismate synthase
LASNFLGQLFRITTWGESHGKAMGVVIDGCPAGLELGEDDINKELEKRAPGKHPLTSPRKEPDEAEIYSGVFNGLTTGAPISIIIMNRDADSSKYEQMKDVLRPGHANYPYLQKYGIFDYRGGGRASARETVCRVAAGAVAKKLLARFGVSMTADIAQVGAESHCEAIEKTVEEASGAGDSVGGVIEFVAKGLPVGIGDPIYDKLEANLAKAMMSIPATKGFEIGSGFRAAEMRGSEHNDPFIFEEGKVRTEKNDAGGILGGISNGMPLTGRVAFKPASSIKTAQQTVTTKGKRVDFELPQGSRHDPCVVLRAVPIVEAMAALVLADSLLMQRCTKL